MQGSFLKLRGAEAVLLCVLSICASCGGGGGSVTSVDEPREDPGPAVDPAPNMVEAIDQLSGIWVTADGCDFAMASLSLAGLLEENNQVFASLVVSGQENQAAWRATLNLESIEQTGSGLAIEYWAEDESTEDFDYKAPLLAGDLTLSGNTLYIPFSCGERAFVATSSLDQKLVAQEFRVVIGDIRSEALERFEERKEAKTYDLSRRGLLVSSTAEEAFAEIARSYLDEIYLTMLPATQAYVTQCRGRTNATP